MHPFFHLLLRDYYRGFPLVLVDVGASGGLHPRWERVREHLQVIGFEPDPRGFEALVGRGTDPGRTDLNKGLYREPGRLTLHLTRKQEASSVFRPNRLFLRRFPEPERFDVVEAAEIDVDTLDRQLAVLGVSDVDFLKLDTQGSELWILEGATETLRRSAVGVEVEAAFAEIYEDQPLFPELHRFLVRQGFRLFDLAPYYWKRAIGARCGGRKGQLVFADCLYLREIDGLEAMVGMVGDPVARRGKLVRMLSICALYGYLDYALEILWAVRRVLDEPEMKVIRRYLERSVSLRAKLGDFPGRGAVSRVLEVLWETVAPTYHGWGSMGGKLGNT